MKVSERMIHKAQEARSVSKRSRNRLTCVPQDDTNVDVTCSGNPWNVEVVLPYPVVGWDGFDSTVTKESEALALPVWDSMAEAKGRISVTREALSTLLRKLEPSPPGLASLPSSSGA